MRAFFANKVRTTARTTGPFTIQRYHVINHNQEIFNGIRNSDKLKNPAAPGSAEFFSLSTCAAEILIFPILRVPFQFFISRDVPGS
jgi:hypothetical protein